MFSLLALLSLSENYSSGIGTKDSTEMKTKENYESGFKVLLIFNMKSTF